MNQLGEMMMPLPQELPPLLTLDQAISQIPSCTILDVRNPQSFASRHLKNAINIPLCPAFPTWAGQILPSNKKIIVTVDHMKEAWPVIQCLKAMNKEAVLGICDASTWSQEAGGALLQTSRWISVDEIHANQKAFFLLDIRTVDEWNAGYINEAHHIEMSCMLTNLHQLPKDQTIAVICRSGTRASIIASLLQTLQFSAFNVSGGMMAWMQSNYPYIVSIEET